MPGTEAFFREDVEIEDLRSVMGTVSKIEPNLFGIVDKREERDRNFLRLKEANNQSKGYRARAPSKVFAESFLDLLVQRGDEIKPRVGDPVRRAIDRLIAVWRRSGGSEVALSGRGAPFDMLTSKYRERVQQFAAARASDTRLIFDGWKIVYRVAFENTGRIAREVIRFDCTGEQAKFIWYFQAAGVDHPGFRRENDGVLLSLNNAYVLMGLHDAGDDRDLRYRSAVIQRQVPGPFMRVQTGIVTSTNARDQYPAAAKFLWVTIPDSEVEDAAQFLNRTVGFFGDEDIPGLEGLAESFEGSGVSDGVISLIWSYIDNARGVVDDERKGPGLLSARQGPHWIQEVNRILRPGRTWGQIIKTYKDAASSNP